MFEHEGITQLLDERLTEIKNLRVEVSRLELRIAAKHIDYNHLEDENARLRIRLAKIVEAVNAED